MESLTFEKYLRDLSDRGIIDFSLRTYPAPQPYSHMISMYIHPLGKDGKTLDFYVSENSLIPK